MPKEFTSHKAERWVVTQFFPVQLFSIHLLVTQLNYLQEQYIWSQISHTLGYYLFLNMFKTITLWCSIKAKSCHLCKRLPVTKQIITIKCSRHVQVSWEQWQISQQRLVWAIYASRSTQGIDCYQLKAFSWLAREAFIIQLY